MRNWNDIPEPSMEPPEPKVIDHCAYCGDEIYSGNPVYLCDEGMVHVDCALGHIEQAMSLGEIAALCGYRYGIAGDG